MVDWNVIAETIRGASHHRNGLPNQDAVKTFQSIAGGFPLIVAVADGHGSARCTHSHIGAQFAVDAAIEIIYQAFALPELTLPQIRDLSKSIPKSIYRSWQEKVDFYSNYITTENAEFILKKVNRVFDITKEIKDYLWCPYISNSLLIQPIDKKRYVPFGTTLLTACVLEHCILYWQIGDGDIVIVQSNGTLMSPISHDDRLLGNDTTSLCRENAWLDFRNAFLPIIETPKAIFLVSDGYKNSFKYKEGFDQALLDIHSYIKTDGVDWVQSELTEWLNEASLEWKWRRYYFSGHLYIKIHMLDHHPREQLILIVNEYGRSIINDYRRCRSLLKDLSPNHQRETNLLLLALEQEVAFDLENNNKFISLPIQLEQLAKRLHTNIGIQREFADWAVETWALALNTIKHSLSEFLKAAIQGDPYAQWRLGWIYQHGQGVKQDFQQSLIWYHKAAEQGYSCAQNDIGILYSKGDGVKQSYKKAVFWYLKAAEQGYAEAQCNLGWECMALEKVEKNHKESENWYLQAAEQGHARAQSNLGVKYENGDGVKQSYKKAVFWYL